MAETSPEKPELPAVIEPLPKKQPLIVKAVPNMERLKSLEFQLLSEKALKERRLFDPVDRKEGLHIGMLPSFSAGY